MNEFSTEICYPEELTDPFYEEETGASYESEEEIKQFFTRSCINEVHYA